MDTVKIGDVVRLERARQGMTQAGLAERAEVSKGRIEAIENHRGLELGLGRVVAILDALGLELRIHEKAGSTATAG
ncbi:helix-turn-helix domain-containing protein [Rhodobacteraceae bacterium 2CG4]|uniref:Helix-turn-helix domain-containing protein n=1 Tax=Halovulum marinum TaxID=2662447 RepID=A0A6L5Z2P0_9RHOB|nr:helix-turn-helix domain-containing protein [Halovulum marinum]MSU90833.1 helix-turn-helix domain-containing protein [Halovulum marinum]